MVEPERLGRRVQTVEAKELGDSSVCCTRMWTLAQVFSTHIKTLGTTACACNPRAGEVEKGGFLELAGLSVVPSW